MKLCRFTRTSSPDVRIGLVASDPDSFTLEAGDFVRITISSVGTLENPVAVV